MAIVVFKSGKSGWRLIDRSFIEGKRIATTIAKEAYPALGFRSDMTIEEARARANQLTKQSLLESRKTAKAAARIAHSKLVNSAYLPAIVVSKFEQDLNDRTLGMNDRIDTLMKHWSTVQKIIVKLELDPKDFYDKRFKIFKIFMEKKFSLDYTGKLLRIFNLWGYTYSRHTNTFFQPIPKPNMNEAQNFIDAREDKVGVRKEAIPLTFAALKKSKSTWVNNDLIEQWNWLFIALWFGLRPKEVDGLKNRKTWRIEIINKSQVLMVFQSKLTNIPKEKRWKPIPIHTKEQREALVLIQEANFQRPLVKTIVKYLGEGFDNYSPRKGFTDLLLEIGFSLEDISVFLGHHSIDTTWKHYKNKMTFKIPKKAG